MRERAVMECFYGPLWTDDARLGVIRAVAAAGATDYVYGPAADERTGARWREPYGEERGSVERMVDDIHQASLHATWRVSPGAPLQQDRAIAYSSGEDLELLRRRIIEVAEIGFDRVLLAFDDLSADLDVAARAQFGHDEHPLAAAQAHVLNRVIDIARDAGLDALVCPQHYWGVRGSRYRARMAALLAPDVPVCWTGPNVTSRVVTVEQVRQVADQWQRPLWLWDNHPVNDWDGISESFSNATTPRRLPLTPLKGREAGIVGELLGYGTNAGLDPLTTLPATLAALLWAREPEAHEPRAALARASTMVGLDADGVGALAQLCGASPVEESPGEVALAIFAAVKDPSTAPEAIAVLERTLADVGRLADDPGFGAWVATATRHLEAGLVGLRLLAGRSEDDAALALAIESLRAEELSVATGSVPMLLDHVRGRRGAPDPHWPDA